MKTFRALAISASTLLPLALGSAVPASTAFGQVKEAPASYLAVAQETASGHCKDSENYYKVVELKKGQVLYCDGASDTWSRVSYPPEATVFVKVEEVVADGDNLKTVAPTKLRAPAMIAGFAASWQPLVATPLPVGTVLRKKEEVR
ncbi:MAG: hypothetical protein ACOYN0_12240, partial [Phycisphaerales bacterium]